MPSPTEQQFATAWQRRFPHLELQSQYCVANGLAQLDFAHPGMKIGVVLGRQAVNSAPEQMTDVTTRERALLRSGWYVLHFSERDIYRDADRCVREVYASIEARSRPLVGALATVPEVAAVRAALPPLPPPARPYDTPDFVDATRRLSQQREVERMMHLTVGILMMGVVLVASFLIGFL